MTLTLELAPEIEQALEDKARRAGVPLADYALRVPRYIPNPFKARS